MRYMMTACSGSPARAVRRSWPSPGEIDESTYPGLVGALKESADGHTEIHVSLAEVDYCDLAGLRAIILLTGTDSYGDNGERPPEQASGAARGALQLQTVLRIVGWDSVPGLALDGQQGGSQPRPAGRTGVGPQAG